MDDQIEHDAGARPTRRDVLRRSALVGGALAWTVPGVQTLAAPAFASGSPAGEDPPCLYTAFVKYDLGSGFSGSEGDGNDTCRLEQCASANVSVSSAGSSANLLAGGAVIGQVTATIDPLNGNCVYLDFSWTNPRCNVDESSSYYIFKDGNDTGGRGRARPPASGSGCEPDDSGLLTDTGVTVDASGDRYRICADAASGGGLSHVNLCLCIKCPASV